MRARRLQQPLLTQAYPHYVLPVPPSLYYHGIFPRPTCPICTAVQCTPIQPSPTFCLLWMHLRAAARPDPQSRALLTISSAPSFSKSSRSANTPSLSGPTLALSLASQNILQDVRNVRWMDGYNTFGEDFGKGQRVATYAVHRYLESARWTTVYSWKAGIADGTSKERRNALRIDERSHLSTLGLRSNTPPEGPMFQRAWSSQGGAICSSQDVGCKAGEGLVAFGYIHSL